ncbi:MAG TPA: hypothetical protein VH520_03340 [Streptosporangiaceae bacterium]
MLRSRPLAARARRVAICGVVPALLAGAVAAWVAAGPLGPHRLTRLAHPSTPALGLPANPDTAASSAFRMMVIRHYGLPANASGYSVILVTGSQQAWAFGGTNPGGPSAPVAALWNGATTVTSSLPTGLTSFISDASATSSSDVWAASQYGRYLLHFDGVRWQVARRWQQGQITGVTAVTPTDVWVFGTSADGTSAIGTWHYDGAAWQRVPGLAGSIVRASAITASDIWAIAASPATYSVLRFDGMHWQQIPTGSALNSVHVRDILAISGSDVWVLGDKTDGSGGVRLVLLHWNGAGWSSLLTPVNAWAGRLAAGPDRTVLVTATPADSSASGLIVQASATGGRLVITPRSWLSAGGISDVALAGRAARSLWVSGAVLTRIGGDAVIWSGQLPSPGARVGA